jgi:hypothetical protein
MDQAVDGREDPIVCAQSLALRSTIAGCSGPTAAPSPVALAAVHPLAQAGLREVVPGRKVVVAVAAADTPGPGVDTVGSGEGSPGLEAGIVVAEEHDHQLALLVRRMNPKHHDHHVTPHLGCPGTRLWRGPFACLLYISVKIGSAERESYHRASSRACHHRATPSSSS